MIEVCPKGRERYYDEACADCRWHGTFHSYATGIDFNFCNVKRRKRTNRCEEVER